MFAQKNKDMIGKGMRGRGLGMFERFPSESTGTAFGATKLLIGEF
jgi:hypothetical protein